MGVLVVVGGHFFAAFSSGVRVCSWISVIANRISWSSCLRFSVMACVGP